MLDELYDSMNMIEAPGRIKRGHQSYTGPRTHFSGLPVHIMVIPLKLSSYSVTHHFIPIEQTLAVRVLCL